MKVQSSNLALRFYKRDGWNQEILDGLVTEGSINKHHSFERDEASGWGGYWLPEPGTKMDMDKLMGLVTSVHRAFDDRPEEDDRSFCERMLW
jgi:hypothetical protein